MKSIRTVVLFLIAFSCPGWSVAQATTAFSTKLFLQFDGIAFSSFPGRHKLVRVTRVERTLGTAIANWTASSSAPWLSATESGQTGGTLTVTADPFKVSGTGLQLGQITVATVGGDFSDTETIRVGLWIGKKNPGLVTFQANATNIATNPVEPVVYVSDGGSTISEYNVYDGTLIAKFKHVAPSLGALEVSSDGLTLFATDMTNYKIVALNADTGAKLGSYKVGYALSSGFNMVYARPYGQPAIYPQGGAVIAYPSGDKLTPALPQGEVIAATRNGKRVFGVVYGESPGTMSSYTVTLVTGALVLKHIRDQRLGGSNCQDIAVSLNGNHIYPACGAPYEFDVYNDKLDQIQTLPAEAYPDNIEIDANGDAVGGLDSAFQDYDVYVYNQAGFLKGKVPAVTSGDGSQLANAMKVSGDCTRVISVVGAYETTPTLVFRNLP